MILKWIHDPYIYHGGILVGYGIYGPNFVVHFVPRLGYGTSDSIQLTFQRTRGPKVQETSGARMPTSVQAGRKPWYNTEGPDTQFLRHYGLKTISIMFFGPSSLIIGYLYPLGTAIHLGFVVIP